MPESSINETPRTYRQSSSGLSSFWLILATGMICLMTTLGLYQWDNNWQRDRISSELDRNTVTYRTLLRGEINSYFDQIDALQRFFNGSDGVSEPEFAAFVGPVLERNPAMMSIIWLPRITKHPDIFPITYIEPLSPDRQGLDLDLSGDPDFTDVFDPFAKSGESGIIPNIGNLHRLTDLYPDTAHLSLIIQPVYEDRGAWAFATPEQRLSHIRGYLVLVFDLARSVESSISGVSVGGIDIDLINTGTGIGDKLLYSHASRAGKSDSALLLAYLDHVAIKRTVPVDIRSANWQMTFSPVAAFYLRNYQWQPEFILSLGLLLTAVVLFVMISIRRRFQSIENVVDARTESLEASQRDQISTLESINDIFFTVDSDWRILYANPKAEAWVGKIDDDVRGNILWDEVPELSSFSYRPLYRAMKKQEPLAETLFQYPPKSQWLMLKAYPQNKGLAIYLSDVTQEVTERKQREQSERRTQAILETAVDCIITINDRGIIKSMNPAGEKIFGYIEDQIIGKNVSMLMPDQDRKQHDGYVRSHIRTGEKKIIGIGREVEGLRANGEAFPIHLSVSRMVVGDTTMFAGVIRDITEQHAAIQEIIEAKETAEIANKAKTSFLNSMGHELRTPLNAVIGFSQMLLFDPDSRLTEKQREYINDITWSGELLLQLVSQILDLSSIEAGRLDLTIEDVDVGDVVVECLGIVRAMAEKRNIVMIDQVSEGEPLIIRSDALRLKQVLINLLSNAVKYNHEGGTVSVKAEQRSGGMVRIYVVDNGPGIPQDQFGRIFEPFDRLGREALNIEGTGSGLTIVNQLVDVLGGKVGLTSEVGKGSSFWIELPSA